MRKECRGCAYWKPIGHLYGDCVCLFCFETGHMKKISKSGKCLSRKQAEKAEGVKWERRYLGRAISASTMETANTSEAAGNGGPTSGHTGGSCGGCTEERNEF